MQPTYVCSFLTGNWPSGNQLLGNRYAQTVAEMVRRHAPGAEFHLFTDRKEIEGVHCRPFPQLDGWFGSLYQFSRDAFPEGSRVFSVDLDTTILGDLTPLLNIGELTSCLVGINDTGPQGKWSRRLTNGVMSWVSGPRYWPIWDSFRPNIGRKRPFRLPAGGECVTDEQWLNYHIKDEWRGWDELLGPGVVMSFKWHLRIQKKQIGPETKIVYFHGRPRPHEVNAPWNPHFLRS